MRKILVFGKVLIHHIQRFNITQIDNKHFFPVTNFGVTIDFKCINLHFFWKMIKKKYGAGALF